VGLREVVRDTPALVARSEDPVSLAQQMKIAMDHRAEVRAVFADYASIACGRFDVGQTVNAMEKIFARTMQRKNGRAAASPLGGVGLEEERAVLSSEGNTIR
jgi:hypothetical protein